MAAEAPINVIVGLGDTGLSVARHFTRTGEKFKVVDSREQPPGLAALRQLHPQVEVELGEFSASTLMAAKALVVSPGISLKIPSIAAASKAGVPVTGDIDLFSRCVDSPIIAVTGSNGKSTVVAMVAAILKQAGVQYGLGGNLDGVNFKPALDLLQDQRKDLYVLELSSFQLETTASLGAAVAVILNVSPDHMDRYTDLAEYTQAKQKIFTGCKRIVLNRDDSTSNPPGELKVPTWTFGLGRPDEQNIGLIEEAGKTYLAAGQDQLVDMDELKIVGQHNIANALAAMALTLAVGIDRQAIAAAIRDFAGLPHRCQWVAQIAGVDFYNDSKGTNIGATMAAIEGLGLRCAGRIVLIAGGIGKGADFSALVPVVTRWVKAIVLIGEDGRKIADQIKGANIPMQFANDMQGAVLAARQEAAAGDAILLSPACASFDMFSNFQHRGQVFISAVESMQ